jgi:DNA-binding response OmpR family regulator
MTIIDLAAEWGRGVLARRALGQHVTQLREKAETDPEKPRALVTVHGVGHHYDT